jgi:hypothetical protein
MKKNLLLLIIVVCFAIKGFAQCTPSIQITTNQTVICQGNPAIFTATPTNGGPSPLYEWFIGTISQGAPTGNPSFATSSLMSTDVVSAQLTSNASCATTTTQALSNNIQIIVSHGIGAGSIGTDQTICYNTIPSALIELFPATGVTGTRIYRWEESADGVSSWSYITGSGSGYTFPTPLTQDVYIRRTVTDPSILAPCNMATNYAIHITVLPEFIPGVIGSDETICFNNISEIIYEIIAPTGATGPYTYQWQSDASGSFTDISGATNSSYAPYYLASTTKFQRIETSASCGTVTSNAVTKTVVMKENLTVTLPDLGTICANGPYPITATVTKDGTGTISYTWSLGGVVVGTNSSTFAYSPVFEDNGKVLSVLVSTSNSCNSGSKTASITLNIITSVTSTVSISTLSNPICEDYPVNFTSNATGGGTTPTYQWYVIPSGSATGNPVGTNSSTLYYPKLQNGDQVYVEFESSLSCALAPNPVRSNSVTMTILRVPSPSIAEADQTICVGSAAEFHATTYAGNIVQWYYNGSPIIGATNLTYIASQTGFYSIQENNGACNIMSTSVTLTIDPCGAFSTTIAGPNPITPGQQNARYSVINQASFSYNWSVTGGTIISGQNTNEVTVDWDNTSPTLRTSSQGYSISVTETNTNQQKKTTSMDVSGQTTGIATSLAQSGIVLFPNPATDAFYIEMPESGLSVSYEILDVTGLSVASGNFISSTSGQQIPTTFGPVMYQVVLHYNNSVTIGRLSKVQ